MKTITPTPSQAAVVLRKFLREQGIELKLSLSQDAIARVYGHSTWNALLTEQPARGYRKPQSQRNDQVCGECRQCGSPLSQGYCMDANCTYHRWPQHVPLGDLQHATDAEIQSRYKVTRRRADEPLKVRSIDYFQDRSFALFSDSVEDLSLAQTLSDELLASLLDTGLLNGYRHQAGRGELALEGYTPYIQVSFDRRLSQRFVTELVFTLRDDKMACYVRTWETRDGLDMSRDYGIFNEQSGDFDTDAKVPPVDEPLEALVQAALAEAQAHKRRLVEQVNIA